MSKSDLLRDIRAAFNRDSSPVLPDEWAHLTDDITSANYSEAIEETARLWGKSWSELDLGDYHACSRAFSFLPKKFVPYYLGGLMEISLKKEPYSYDILELFPLFDPSHLGRKKAKQDVAFNRLQVSSLDAKQRHILLAFLRFLEAAGLEDERSTYMQKFLLEELSLGRAPR